MSSFARALALGALTAAAIALPAAAQVMVVRAQGPSAAAYRAGTLLPANQPIQLAAGDHLTVLDGGGTRQFDGPGRFLTRQPSAQAKSALTALLSQNPRTGHRLGAARGIGSPTAPARPLAAPANIWQIDLALPGDFCVAASQPIELWRRDTDAATVVITRMRDDSKRTLTWRAGEAALDWPVDLPLADGEAYLVSTTDGMDAGVIWRAVAPPSDDWIAFAGQLVQRGCYAQLDTLRVALGAPAAP
ncbi:MAG TPA: hypothetical protein VII63_00630 [Caulobacteraceae bacterium]